MLLGCWRFGALLRKASHGLPHAPSHALVWRCAAPGAQRFTVVVAFLLPEAEARFRGLLLALAARGARVLTIVFQLERGGGLELRGRVGNYVYLYTAPRG
jgi:hypothetical protein